MPWLKKAELIDGVVYVPSPVSLDHGSLDTQIHWWLAQYAYSTPGCQCGNNSTWLMLDSAPQPDSYLRILPAYGGQLDRLSSLGGLDHIDPVLSSTKLPQPQHLMLPWFAKSVPVEGGCRAPKSQAP